MGGLGGGKLRGSELHAEDMQKELGGKAVQATVVPCI
jgi:hypothetical protein